MTWLRTSQQTGRGLELGLATMGLDYISANSVRNAGTLLRFNSSQSAHLFYCHGLRSSFRYFTDDVPTCGGPLQIELLPAIYSVGDHR